MNAPAKLAGFAATLAVLFGVGALLGGAIDPDRSGEARAQDAMSAHGGGGHAEESDPVRGLAVAENGLRLVVDDPELRRGRLQRLRFRIVDEHGATVRDFDVAHEKRMHLIVARRDLTGFQHLHPVQGADGTWTAGITLRDAGSYRMFADFTHDGSAFTLADDLRVDGAADLRPLPQAEPTAVADGGYDVRLDAGAVRPGREADLRFTISKHGRTVQPEPYLGASGHLVALREGDLAFLHVHPDESGYMATFPTAGRYRLFLQFKDGGRVHTAAFTQEVAGS